MSLSWGHLYVTPGINGTGFTDRCRGRRLPGWVYAYRRLERRHWLAVALVSPLVLFVVGDSWYPAVDEFGRFGSYYFAGLTTAMLMGHLALGISRKWAESPTDHKEGGIYAKVGQG